MLNQYAACQKLADVGATRRPKRMTTGPARRWAGAVTLALAVALAGATTAGAQQAKRPLIVQSTTSVRDSGVLDQLITPQFEKRFPQYDLKFVAVGTGQAGELRLARRQLRHEQQGEGALGAERRAAHGGE